MGPRYMKMGNGKSSKMQRSPNIVKVIKYGILRCTGHVARMESPFKILTCTPIEVRLLGKPKPKWEDTLGWLLKK